MHRLSTTLAALLAAFTAHAAERRPPPAPPDWIEVRPSDTCDGTDVDFSDADHGFATCAFSKAMTTSDGGLTWNVFDTGLQQSLLWAHAESATDLYAARLGYYRSTDGGRTWNEVGTLSDNVGNSVFGAQLAGKTRRVALQGSEVYVSTDGGDTWNQTFAPPDPNIFFQKLVFATDSVAYVAGGITHEFGSAGFVARSTDAGDHFDMLTFPYGQVSALDFRDADHGVAASGAAGHALYVTADGGATWTPIGPLPNGGWVLDLAHRDDRHWYAATYDGCLYETLDAGTTWTPGYCDTVGQRAIAAIDAAKAGAAIAVGNDGLVLYENRIFKGSFE